MINDFVKKSVEAYLNYRSFKTNRQLILIESDDWGSVRTQNIKTLNKLNDISRAVKQDPYIQLDSIASSNDLSALFEILNSVRDSKGNPACITANVCTANPDFNAIKASNFNEFHYEIFTQTLDRYSHTENLLDLWKKAEKEKLFYPQLHGREHVHAPAWLAELRAGNKDLLKAFELNSFGIPYNGILFQKRKNFQAALDSYNTKSEELHQKKWIKDSVDIFKNTFGYYSKSFISPAYIWHNNLHIDLYNSNVKSLQGIKLQYEPNNLFKNNYKRKLHYTGEIDKTGLLYTTRNTFFEPASIPQKDWVSSTLKGVEKAFQNKQPAIIGSHRINYIGSLNPDNRSKNLIMLKTILQKLVKDYRNVEFINSADLADLISEKF